MQISNNNNSTSFGKIGEIGKAMGRGKKNKTMKPISHKFEKMEKRFKNEFKSAYENCSTKISEELKNISEKFLDLLI